MIKQNMEYRSKSDFNLPIFILIFYYLSERCVLQRSLFINFINIGHADQKKRIFKIEEREVKLQKLNKWMNEWINV